ncbi:uncharacterized protein FA14DRAFT_70277 [Meira miltonrushii]|uniref:SRP9 domain-containing protein n=1 Tax=Meira miltonrushii TaxID=1280837 RepID=A0A316V9N2_9BASI|nr:uncharacterized protein FA14DRAFT_70277 [Meira miltonrushii]PWN34210.1 hypothetical protein FA14DRAFT_70277 [Meira miltonrushii]
MVYIKRWAEFHSKCVELYKKSPNDTRYLIKATPSQQWLVLKVTDDNTVRSCCTLSSISVLVLTLSFPPQCLKFRARSAIIINRFESFTRDMTALMADLPLPSEAAAAALSKSAQNVMDIDTEAAGAADTTTKAGGAATGNATAGGGSGGGANKKKKKKGKK